MGGTWEYREAIVPCGMLRSGVSDKFDVPVPRRRAGVTQGTLRSMRVSRAVACWANPQRAHLSEVGKDGGGSPSDI